MKRKTMPTTCVEIKEISNSFDGKTRKYHIQYFGRELKIDAFLRAGCITSLKMQIQKLWPAALLF
jgi:hypothetical protein